MNSIVNYKDRGYFGKSNYRGNTSGKIILDLHKVYKFDEVSDYMSGSFTTKDVAKYLNISSNCYDLNSGFDLIDNDIKERNEFIFWHPPILGYVRFVSAQHSWKQELKADMKFLE